MGWPFLPTVVLMTMTLPLAALTTGNLPPYSKGVFLGSCIGMSLAFAVMTGPDMLREEGWWCHMVPILCVEPTQKLRSIL